MKFEVFDVRLSICKVPDLDGIDLDREFTFISRTPDEISIVCPSPYVPASATERDDGWRCFRISGKLDFSLIGILSEVSSLLAKAGIGIFAVSTYDTDYILVKENDLMPALDVLKGAGHSVKG